MKRMLFAFVLLVLLLFGQKALKAQEAIPTDKIVFAPSLKHAQMEAKERNCPIFAFIHTPD